MFYIIGNYNTEELCAEMRKKAVAKIKRMTGILTSGDPTHNKLCFVIYVDDHYRDDVVMFLNKKELNNYQLNGVDFCGSFIFCEDFLTLSDVQIDNFAKKRKVSFFNKSPEVDDVETSEKMFYIVGKYDTEGLCVENRNKLQTKIYNLTGFLIQGNPWGNNEEFIVKAGRSTFTYLTKEEIDNFENASHYRYPNCILCDNFLSMSDAEVSKLFEHHRVYIPVVIAADKQKPDDVLRNIKIPSEFQEQTAQAEQIAALKYEIEKRDEEIAALKDRMLSAENKPINRDLSIISPMDKWRMK